MQEEQIKLVLELHSGMKYNEVSHELSGVIYITPDDFYEVRIALQRFPARFPVVIETEERIPKKEDRHIYPEGGSLCFTTRAIEEILLKTKITDLQSFIRDILIPYLQNNSLYEIHGKYFDQEYEHGAPGILQGYQDILDIQNPVMIAKIMIAHANGEKIKAHDKCYCGMGLSLLRCSNGDHRRNYKNFKLIDKRILLSDLENHLIPLIELINSIKK